MVVDGGQASSSSTSLCPSSLGAALFVVLYYVLRIQSGPYVHLDDVIVGCMWMSGWVGVLFGNDDKVSIEGIVG